MKKTIIILGALGLGVSIVGAQSRSAASVASDIYKTEAWAKAVAGYYGVDSGVEPKIEDRDRETLGQIATTLQVEGDASVLAAADILQNYIRTQESGSQKPSATVLQLAGMLNQRLADIANNDGERRRRTELAETYLRRAVETFPNFLRAHKNLANLLFKAGRQDEALTHFVRSVELGDNDAITFGIMGAIYMEKEKYISAESALKKSLMINPKITEFKQLLGNTLYMQERYLEAKEMFGELIQENPSNAVYWKLQANCFISLEMLDEATKNLEIVRFMGESDSPSLMLLGDVYMNKEMVNDAAAAYKEAIRTGGRKEAFGAYINAASVLSSFEAYDHAMEILELVESSFGRELSPEQEIEVLAIRSEVNIARGRGAEAAENLESILRRDPLNARALLSLASYYSDLQPDESLDENARILQRRRNVERAVIYYERAENLDNDDTRRRALIGHAQLMVRDDKLREAADLLEEAQSILYQDTIQRYLDQIKAALRARGSR